MAKLPHQLTFVKLRDDVFTSEKATALPFYEDFPLVFLGEIQNMPGHGIFAGHRTGRIYSGYHIDQFVELDEDEV
jgi:hypothetical protein